MESYRFWIIRLVSIVVTTGLLLPSSCVYGDVARDVDYLSTIEYADNKDRLDVHMPDDATSTPVVLFFHGGALAFGDKSHGDGIAERLMPLGIGVVSANYRLSPDAQHPAHVQDAAAAFAWTVSNIAEYGGDPSRIYVTGHSAGAYLAALLALDAKHLGKYGLGLDAIAGAVLISPFLYVEETARERPKTVWGTNPDDWLAASVTPHIGPDKGKFLLLYADGDDTWRKEQNERFALTMQKIGNTSVNAVELLDRNHSTLVTRINEPSDEIGDQIREFVEK